MVKREGQWITIHLGATPDLDRVRASFRILDDVEGTESPKDRDLNVGAQGQAVIGPVVDWVLGKLTNVDRIVTRPAP